MIVSASYRTDIPAFYGEWFRRRLTAGFCRVANPYGGPPSEVPLAAPAVEGFVFWTRNPGPFLPVLDEVAAKGLPFVVQATVTGYPRALESSVLASDSVLASLRAIAARHGPKAVVWRYDPVLLTSLTPPAWHRETFSRLAAALTEGPQPVTDEVVLSFAHVYAKTRRNTEQAAAHHGFTWEDPPEEVKRALLCDLASLAGEAGLSASLCAQPDLLGPGLRPARCIDVERLSAQAGRSIAARTKGNRPGCLCAESRDIGAYDSCPHGCVYCYAVHRPALAKTRFKSHDPENTFLIDPAPTQSRRAHAS